MAKLTRHHKKGIAGCERRSDPFCDPPKVGTPELGNSASNVLMMARTGRFRCVMDHIKTSG
jgi:hypothetical protein